MYEQPPFSEPGLRRPDSSLGTDERVAVVVPTRDRPDRLSRCLAALAAARDRCRFRAYVCDSSTGPAAGEVARTCAQYPFVELVPHDRLGAPAARNVGVACSREELVVSVDDDVYVAPDAIAELVRAYDRGSGLRVVAGSVDWGDWASEPLAMRWIGFPRKARPDQEVEILISALVLYPAELARQCPWNERLWPYDDLWVSLAWRMQGATLVCAAGATAKHDATHSVYRPEHAADHIYTNLFDALIVRRSILRLLSYETFGLLAGVKHWVRSLPSALGFSRAWIHGHRAFVSDLSALRGLSRGRE